MPHDPAPPPTLDTTDSEPVYPVWDGPVSTRGRPLPRWVVDLPWVLAHFIVDVDDTPEAPDPTLAAFAARGPVEARVRAHYRGRVYAVRNVSEETWATLAAQYSRSPNTLRDNIRAAIACGDMPLPPEVSAFLPSADTTESPDDYRDIAETRRGDAVSKIEAKAAAFHRKWTVGYGHSSVAEGATLRLCVDGCSLWAAKALEDARIGVAYTEKSTRYVPFDDGAQPPEALWVQPAELGLDVADYPDGDSTATPSDGGTAAVYAHAMQHWFTVYRDAVARLTVEARALPGVDDGTSPAALRGWVLDRARDFLPIGARTGLAMTINARALAHHIRRLGAADQTPEVRYLGALLTAVGTRVCPGLIRHVEPRDNAALCNAVARVALPAEAFLAGSIPAPTSEPEGTDGDDDTITVHPAPGSVTHADTAGEDSEAAKRRDNADLAWAILVECLRPAAVAGQTHGPVAPLARFPHNPEAVIRAWSEARGPHEGLSRAAEAVTLTGSLAMTFGAWRDIQRHRKLTHYRFSYPCLANGLGHDPAAHPGCDTLRDSVRHGITTALSLEYRAGVHAEGGVVTYNGPDSQSLVPFNPSAPCTPARAAALYALPLVIRVRAFTGGTLRAWAQMVELRSRREGHDEYRVIAQRMGDFLMAYFPGLSLRIDREPRTFARK